MTNLFYGVDLSHYNNLSNASAARAQGISFAWAKATQGINFIDPTFSAKVIQLKSAGILTGAYHYADGTDPKKQAQHFKSIAGPAGVLGKGNLIPMLDMEDATVRGNANDVICKFYDTLGVAPLNVYADLDWWKNVLNPGSWGKRNIVGHIARYNKSAGSPGFAWTNLGLHQYDAQGNINGIGGGVDRDSTMPGWTLDRIVIGGSNGAVTPVTKEGVDIKLTDKLNPNAAQGTVNEALNSVLYGIGGVRNAGALAKSIYNIQLTLNAQSKALDALTKTVADLKALINKQAA